MRRLLLTLTVAGLGLAFARPVDAQLPIKFGVQGAMVSSLDEATQLDGSFGIGARVALEPPALPIGAVVQGVYYFPDDGAADLTYITYSGAVTLGLPLPMIKPYAIAGWQFRRTSIEGFDSSTESGAMLGAGVQLDLGLSLFLEGTFEFNEDNVSTPDLDNDPIVFKGGILFG